MTSMQQWTTGQWAVFAVTIIIGLAAVALAYAARSAILGWTAPAPLRVATAAPATPRPRLMLTDRRPPSTVAVSGGWIEPTRHVPVIVGADGTWTDPALTDYLDGGIGALSAIQQAEADPIMETAAERDTWIHAYGDLKPMMTETAAAREAMRIAIEPAERKARLWLMHAGEVGARAVLTSWRMDTPTAELPALDYQYLTAYALLVS